MRKLEVAYIETINTISVTLNGRFRSLSLNTDQGQKLLAAVQESPQDLDKIAELADIATYITRHTFGRVIVDDKDRLRLDGKVVDYGLSEIILRLLTEGANVSHLTKFLENVSANPDPSVPEHLYSFLQKGGMPITPDGCFHAFKKVDTDYRSFHSGNEDVTVIDANGVPEKFRGRIPHPVGGVVLMDRELCNPNRDQTCSVGLHACSPYYLESWYGSTGVLLIVKIDPKDVTAIPSDYNDAKLRTCRLEVVAEIPQEDAKTHFAKALESRYTTAPVESLGTVTLGGEPIGEVTEITITAGEGEDLRDVLNLTEEDEVEEDFVPCEDCDCGADGRMTFEEAIMAGIEEGTTDAENAEFFCGDPEDGDSWYEVPEHHDMAYLLAYSSAYAEAFELEPFHSTSAFEQGVTDGIALAEAHIQTENFDPDHSAGANSEEIPEAHEDAYGSGFTIGYLSVFMGNEQYAEIAGFVDAELESRLVPLDDAASDEGTGDGVVGD